MPVTHPWWTDLQTMSELCLDLSPVLCFAFNSSPHTIWSVNSSHEAITCVYCGVYRLTQHLPNWTECIVYKHHEEWSVRIDTAYSDVCLDRLCHFLPGAVVDTLNTLLLYTSFQYAMCIDVYKHSSSLLLRVS